MKNFILLTFFGLFFFLLSTKTIFAETQESLFSFSLNFQKFITNFWQKVGFKKDDIYKEKYYELLQELAKLKLISKTNKDQGLSDIKEKYLPKTVEVDVFKKDAFGNYYVSVFPDLEENMIVIDENWILVGKIKKIFKNYALVESLETPNLEFNATNIDGQLIGLAKTVSNGFLEINFIDPNIELKKNNFVLTGDGVYPGGFVIGSIVKINQNQLGKKVIVKLGFDSDANKFLVIKK